MDFTSVKFAPKYEVSMCGTVRNATTKYVLGQHQTPTSEYLYVSVRVDGEKRHHSVHRMVASAWLPNHDDLPQINHKDGNKHNNHASNLEWCTAEYNAQHARDNGLATYKQVHWRGKLGAEHNRSVIVVAYPSRQVFCGLSEASRELDMGISRIHYLLRTGTIGRDGVSFKYITPMIRT